MDLLNALDVETPFGLRSFELRCGDLTALDERVDLLAVSAFAVDLDRLAADKDGYAHVGHTLLGALYQATGVDVATLRCDCDLDLRAALGCWISRDTGASRFGRVVCLEDVREGALEDAVHGLFVALSVLEQRRGGARTLALPVLGAGGARMDPRRVIAALLDRATFALTTSPTLARVLFVERDPERARLLDAAMDEKLARVRVALPRGVVFDAVRRELRGSLDAASALASPEQRAALVEIARVVAAEDARSYQIGLMGRRLVELVLGEVGPKRREYELWRAIDALAARGVAGWMLSYMHTLRVLGNESAHERGGAQRVPASVGEADLLVALFCMQRVLELFVGVRRRATSP